MTDRIETTLRWAGDWPWWIGVPLALLLGVGAFVFYRRDVSSMPWWPRAALPLIRSTTVFLVVTMLSGPVLHHRQTIGQLTKLWIFLDSSQSMSLTDSSMDTGRKILILQRLGLLGPDVVKLDLPKAAEALADAQNAAERALAFTAIEPAQWKQLTNEFAGYVENARGLLSGPTEAERLDRLTRELLQPAKELSNRTLQQIDDRDRALRDLSSLGDGAKRWQEELRTLFDKGVVDQLAADSSPLRAALLKFDSLPRWQRVQALLLEGEPQSRALAALAGKFDVQVLSIEGHTARSIWQPSARGSALPESLPKPTSNVTDLATGLRTGIGATEKAQRGAVILLSDGQHNEGESPVEIARVLGGKGTPIFPIGVGTPVRPRDLAILRVSGPESVFHEDRYRGEVVIKDDAAVGQPFTISIRDGDKIVWEKKLLSENRPVRRIPFDLPVKELAEPRQHEAELAAAGANVTGFPIELKTVISPVEGEQELSNNESALRFRAITQKRRILILDGRPRWETRYLRNMFERDAQWEVNTVIAGTRAGEPGFARGNNPEQFPSDQGKLDTYDLIFFGEVQRSTWKGEELRWLREFVEKRGGAMIFIDGPRGFYAGYDETPLAPLFPVDLRKARSVRAGITHLVLTERAAQIAAFTLSLEGEGNPETWSRLQPPHWLSGATPVPGAETLLEAEVNGQRVPAAVTRVFGAGKVYYQGFEDSWRWRYEVADQWHVKFWVQIANFTAEPPFSVRDKFVSLDAGAITYQPGQTADIRVRLRDGEGRPVSNATVDAVLTKDGEKVATIRLNTDEAGGGVFRGRTAPLEAGSYEVSVATAAIPDTEMKARTTFKVEPRETGELTQLSANEDLLHQMASASGGRFFREEHFDRVLEHLAPMSQGKVIESDTVLWQSWWWFSTIVCLLTGEWILRKRAGML